MTSKRLQGVGGWRGRTWPALLARPVASPGRRADSGTWAERVGCQGADRRPAWPCAAPRSLWAATGMVPALHRSRARARAHHSVGRVAPRPGAWAPTSRECAPSALEPSGPVPPARPVPANAVATDARSCDVRLNLARWPCASAPDSPSRPLGTGHGGVDGGSLEEMFHVCLVRGRQPDASHLVQPPCMRNRPRECHKKDEKSSAACMRGVRSSLTAVA
jgi:hypothetical protein